MSTEKSNDVLENNYKSNQEITNGILAIYGGSFITLVVLLLNKITNFDSFETTYLLKQLGIFIILVMLSIQSVIFYIRLITKMQDTNKGKLLSVILALVLLILVVAGIYFGKFTLVGLGILFICWKAGQLYNLAKDQGIGELTIGYFQKIYRVYMIFTIISLVLGFILDFTDIKLLPEFESDGNYSKLKVAISELDLERNIETNLLNTLNNFNEELLSTKFTISISFGLAIYLFFIILLYAIYKAFLVKAITIPIIHDELMKYYKSSNSDSKPKNPNGGGGASLSVIPFFILTRPFMSFIAGAISVSIYYHTSSDPIYFQSVMVFFTVFLTSAFGFTINDYFDIEKDKIEHKSRILPSGLMTKETALNYAYFLGVFSLFISALVNFNVFLLNVITIFLLGVYSIINNNNGIYANIITAINSSFVIIIGMLAGHFDYIITFVALATFFMIFGREIILDIRDIKSDNKINKISLPIKLGKQISFTIVDILFLISTIITILLSYNSDSYWFKIFVGLIFNIALWSTYLYFRFWSNEKSLNLFLTASRISFLALVPGILL